MRRRKKIDVRCRVRRPRPGHFHSGVPPAGLDEVQEAEGQVAARSGPGGVQVALAEIIGHLATQGLGLAVEPDLFDAGERFALQQR